MANLVPGIIEKNLERRKATEEKLFAKVAPLAEKYIGNIREASEEGKWFEFNIAQIIKETPELGVAAVRTAFVYQVKNDKNIISRFIAEPDGKRPRGGIPRIECRYVPESEKAELGFKAVAVREADEEISEKLTAEFAEAEAAKKMALLTVCTFLTKANAKTVWAPYTVNDICITTGIPVELAMEAIDMLMQKDFIVTHVANPGTRMQMTYAKFTFDGNRTFVETVKAPKEKKAAAVKKEAAPQKAGRRAKKADSKKAVAEKETKRGRRPRQKAEEAKSISEPAAKRKAGRRRTAEKAGAARNIPARDVTKSIGEIVLAFRQLLKLPRVMADAALVNGLTAVEAKCINAIADATEK